MRRFLFQLVTAAVAFSTPLGAQFVAPDKVAGVASASDSDTIRILGISFRIRLYGIDAPEAAQTCNAQGGGKWQCGLIAALELRRLVDGKEVACHRAGEGQDQYNRMLAICYVDERNINEHMVEQGLAWSFRRYSHDYDALEEKAKARGIGIWQASLCTQPAWDYRRNAWEDALREAPEGRPIKGNFARRGDCIYHTPWSPHWRKVNMNKPGNRWFANEADAIEAGCRAPKLLPLGSRDMSQEAIDAALPCGAIAQALVPRQ